MTTALLLAILSTVAIAADAPSREGPAIGAKAPAFTLHDASGKSFSLSDYAGKIVVLEWINHDCPIDTRVLNSKLSLTVEQKYQPQGVVWLAIDSTSTHTAADYKKTAEMFGIPYPILNDADGAVGHAYAAKTTPNMFIINKDGTLVYKGGIDNDPNGRNPTDRVNYVDQALAELLAGKTVSINESKPYGCSVKYAN